MHSPGVRSESRVPDEASAWSRSFISDVNVNEEPHPPVPEMEFTDEEEWLALSEELARLDEFEAKKDIPRGQATGPLLTFKWVRTVKNGMPNYRLCFRPFGRQSERSKESLYCPTPGPQISKNDACFGGTPRLERQIL